MASRAHKAGWDAAVNKRLDAATTALSSLLGIDVPDPVAWVRDQEYLAISQRERLAVILERTRDAIVDELEGSNPMGDLTFPVINDQSGDAQDVTMDQWADLQMQGYRIANTSDFAAAQAEDQQPVEATAPQHPNAEQSKADEDYFTTQTFPQADLGDDAADISQQEQAAADTSGGDQPMAYDDMSNAQLRAEVGRRGLQAESRKNADLIAALEADDQAE